MKNVKLILLFLLSPIFSLAQSPQLLNYQGVARGGNGSPIASQAISIRLSLRDMSATGAILYIETHTVTTNSFGLFSLHIGAGTVQSGLWSAINWGNGSKFLEIEMDQNGGASYTNIGTQQLVSVPFALYANSSRYADSSKHADSTRYADTAKYTLTQNANPGWELTGNSGTNPANNFIGTKDTSRLIIKVNNELAGKIEYNAYSSTSFGYQALKNNTANVNAAFGYQALSTNTSGSANTALGTYSLFSNQTGTNNTGNGYQSLYNNTASYNTGCGFQTLYNNTTGSQNTAVGSQALYNNTTGSQNTFVQSSSGGNTTGIQNTGIGFGALWYNTIGNNNTAIGTNSGPSSCCANLVNTTSLGYNATVSSSNTVIIGSSSVTSIKGQVGFTTFSDARIKNNVVANVPGLIFIKQLRPVTYNYDVKKENELLGVNDDEEWEGKYDIEKVTFSGFIAQEVEATAQQINYNFSGVDKQGSIMGIRYADFIPSLVRSIQEQQEMIQALQKEVAELKKNR